MKMIALAVAAVSILFLAGCSSSTQVNKCAAPTFSPAGGTFQNWQNVFIHCATENPEIRYTTDGTEPSEESALYVEPVHIPLYTTVSIRAKAFRDGWSASRTASARFIVTGVLPPTAFDPPAGAYNTELDVTISCPVSDAIIKYTTDGSEPDIMSETYISPVHLSQSETIRAKAFKRDWMDSAIASSAYNLMLPTVAAPVFDPPAGYYVTAQLVTITSATQGATIRYTINGTEPNANSTLYGFPVYVPTNTVLKARAFKTDMLPSPVSAASYAILGPPPHSEMIMVPGGTIYPGEGIFAAGLTVSTFYISKYELSQNSYQYNMQYNPSSGYAVGPNYPVYNVNWFNAIEYCNRRSLLEGLNPCYSYGSYGTNPDNWPSGWDAMDSNHTNVNFISANGYRLPTEAEWEYAARGGRFTHNYPYSGSTNLNSVAWFVENNSPYGPKLIGTKFPNELDIHDMSGNVWEWCWGQISTYDVVGRGGGYNSHPYSCEVSYRRDYSAGDNNPVMGFRVCRSSM